MFLHHQPEKKLFSEWLHLKDRSDDYPFACRDFFKAFSIDFLWNLKLSDIFVSSALAS